jgi:hypothetical protein
MIDQNNTQEDEALTDFSNSPNFVGSILVAVDGDVYSLKQKEDGTFGGYKINYGTDGSIVSAYELNEQDLTYLKEKGALVVYEKNNNKRQDEEDVDIFEETKTLIMKLFKEGDKFDLSKRLPDDIKEEIKVLQEKISQIESNDQKELATYFFDHAIMKEYNTKNAYQIYSILKGTTFSDYFRQLEDLRLRGYGYGGFTL